MKNNIITIGFVSALCTAIYRSLDNYAVHNLVTAPDSLTAVFAYLILGSWTGVFVGTAFSLAFGKKLIDPDFSGIVVNNPKMQKQALISGAISAGSTLFIMLGNQIGDPSVVIALVNLTIIYTILYDVLTNQVKLNQLLIPSALIIIGGMMAAFNGSLAVTILGFIYVVILSNGLSAYSEIVETKGIRASDSVNLFIWRFFWLAFTGTTLALVVSFNRGYLELLLKTVQSSMIHLPWIIATMIFVFFGMGLKFYLKKDQAVSIVLLIMSMQLFLSYPITIFGSWIKPGMFGDIPISPITWLVRMAGSILIIFGLSQIRLSNISLKSS